MLYTSEMCLSSAKLNILEMKSRWLVAKSFLLHWPNAGTKINLCSHNIKSQYWHSTWSKLFDCKTYTHLIPHKNDSSVIIFQAKQRLYSLTTVRHSAMGLSSKFHGALWMRNNLFELWVVPPATTKLTLLLTWLLVCGDLSCGILNGLTLPLEGEEFILK